MIFILYVLMTLSWIALCEINESCVSTKGVDEESDRILSGVTAKLQQKAGFWRRK